MGRVLVVEDEPELRQALALLLEDEGFDVISAENGARALDALEATRPDVILLDLHMPVMDGHAFAHAYNARPGPHAPIIVCTTRSREALSNGLSTAAYVRKPVDLDRLISLIRGYTLNAHRA